eukprot:3031530-Rhodomonas_salina.3
MQGLELIVVAPRPALSFAAPNTLRRARGPFGLGEKPANEGRDLFWFATSVANNSHKRMTVADPNLSRLLALGSAIPVLVAFGLD